MAGFAQEQQAGSEPGWEFVEMRGHSPSSTSQMSMDEIFPSPYAGTHDDFERCASTTSYAGTEAAHSPGVSTWNQSGRMLPGFGVADAGRGRHDLRQGNPSTSTNAPGAPTLNSPNGFVPAAHLAHLGPYSARAMESNSYGDRQHPPSHRAAPARPQFGNVNWDIPSPLSDPTLFDVNTQRIPTQILSGTGMAFGEPFELQGTPLNPFDPADGSMAHGAPQLDLPWPDLDLCQLDLTMAHGTVPPSLPSFTSTAPGFDADSQLDSFLTPLPNMDPSTSPHSTSPLSTLYDPMVAAPSIAGITEFNPAHFGSGYQTGQAGEREDTSSQGSSQDIPLRLARRLPTGGAATGAPNTKSMPASDSMAQDAGSAAGGSVPFFFEEVLTPSNKGRSQRRSAERQPQARVTKRAGGRVLGTHLDQETLQHTNKLRQIGACWICRFQRDKCLDIGGVTCGPCARRQNSAHFQSEHSLGCDRTNIVNYRDDLLPHLMTAHYKQQSLEDFAQKNIGSYLRQKTIVIQLRIDTELPWLESETYEFEAKTPRVLQHIQYRRNQQNEWVRELRPSPPLCMTRNPREEVYEKYVDTIVDTKLKSFARTAFQDSPNDFQRRLLELLCDYQPATDMKELRNVFRFLVTRILVTRTWTIPEQIRDQALSQMKSYRPGMYGRSCSPRMTNKQVKSCFNGLHSTLLQRTLGSYQEILRKSGGKWVTAFIMVLVLAMVTEDCQKMMHAAAEENAALGYYSKEDGERMAVYLAQNQDHKWYHVMSLFRAKFTARGFNPFRDGGMKKLKEKNRITPEEVRLVQEINNLMMEKSDFLHGRQHVPIAYVNQGQYTSRLVARFLLHFWSDPS